MTERVASDHDSIETYRTDVETVGRTDRVRIVLPDGVDVSEGDVVECALDGDAGYASVESALDGSLVVRRVTANRRQAREGDGENRLATWVETADVRVGGSVHFDVVTPGESVGLRTPGRHVVYRVTEPPSGSLADIAADLDGE